MGERKVLNKYFPPDYDPEKVPRKKMGKEAQMKVRMMLPCSIRCNTCGVYLYKGTKFNSRKEDVVGETYLGMQIIRFYIRCSRCSAEISFKTDLQNSDYTIENGASRNYEPWRDKDAQEEEQIAEREREEMGDAMRALENRTKDSKMEIDILNALDEMKSLNSRHAKVTDTDVLAAVHEKQVLEARTQAQRLQAEEDAAVAAVSFGPDQGFVRRLSDSDGEGADEDAAAAEPPTKRARTAEPSDSSAPAPAPAPSFAVKAKPLKITAKPKAVAPAPAPAPATGLAGLAAYGSDSDSGSG
mmetsp:Transcript_4173/g.14552  ORF Transcript_4173/g.14552 Transcript_4173/m.14552 type:complete len:299 (-) Transcript_4173:351-1247(-)